MLCCSAMDGDSSPANWPLYRSPRAMRGTGREAAESYDIGVLRSGVTGCGLLSMALLLATFTMSTSAEDGSGTPSAQHLVFFESFDSLATHLIPAGNDTMYGDGSLAWSPAVPPGWRTDHSGLVLGGCTEFEGWTPWDLDVYRAAEEGREDFTLGSGVALVADGGQYSQCGDVELASSVTSPVMDIGRLWPGTARLEFHSSFSRGGQEPMLRIQIHYGGVSVVAATSQDLNLTYPEATNQRLQVQLDNPMNATQMVVEWKVSGETDSQWWWVIDDISVTGTVDATPQRSCRSKRESRCKSPEACLSGRIKNRMLSRLRSR